MKHREAADTPPAVAVTIVTFNSARYIERCLDYLLVQDYKPLRIIVVDNASMDDTPSLLSRYRHCVKIVYNEENVGFAGGQNQAIALTDAAWVLTLNPDVRCSPDFVSRLVEAGQANPQIGTVCGKLLAMKPDFALPKLPVFDSTGIYMTPSLRHFDRGSRTPDAGTFNHPEYVFGATGAAALYRRAMIEDISVFGEFFDRDFFAYREDADVAWRAQLLGWKCLYTPVAVAHHVRTVLPSNRRSLPPAVNMHSVKNRFLLRIKNTTARLYLRHFVSITARDLVVVGGCLLYEFRSLAAFPFLFRNFARTWRKRRIIMSKRRTSNAEIESWFQNQPVSYPAEPNPSGSQNTTSSQGQKMAAR